MGTNLALSNCKCTHLETLCCLEKSWQLVSVILMIEKNDLQKFTLFTEVGYQPHLLLSLALVTMNTRGHEITATQIYSNLTVACGV